MPREFSVIVSINAARARAGGREFKRGADTVVRSSRRMTTSMNRSRKSATALITTIGRIRGVATLAFAGFLGVGGLGAVTKTIAQFEQGMKRVEALLGDRAVGGAMSALTMKARELGATTAFTATQAAEGMGFLTLAGFDALETFQAIEPALQLAQAGMLGLGEASDIVSNIMQGFNIEASKTQEVVDALAHVATRSNTSIRQLGQAMKFVAPVAGAVGLSVKETAAALGLLGNSGLQASLAGTSLRRVLSGLLNPSREATNVLKKLGLESKVLVDALSDPEKGLTFVIRALEASGIGAAEAFTLFGQRGAPGLLSLIGQTDDLIKFNEQLKDVAGTARTIGKVMLDNISGDARIAISVLQEAIIRLGEAGLREWLRDVTQAFAGFIRGISDQEQAIEGATERVLAWNKAGIALRENIGLIRKALVVLVTFMSRVFIGTILKGTAAMLTFGFSMVKGATAVQALRRVILLLAVSMKTLRTAIISTGIGAFAIALGFLLDWIFFSDDAISSNSELETSMNRLRATVENQAFKWAILTEELRGFAVIDLQTLIASEENALVRMSRQLKNATIATEKITQAKQNLAMADELVAEIAETASQRSGTEIIQMGKNEEGLRAVAQATIELQHAQEFLSTTSGVTVEALAEQEALVATLNLRLAGFIAIQSGVVKTMKEYLMMINNVKDANELLNEGLRDQLGLTPEQTLQLQDLITKYAKNVDKLADLRESLDLVNMVMGNAKVVAAGYGREVEDLTRAQEELEFAIRKLELALSPSAKALEKVTDKMNKLKAGEDKVKLAIVAHIIEMRNLTREMIIANAPIDEQAEALENLAAQHRKNIEVLEAECEATEELERCMDDSAKRMEKLWDQALRNIQDAFADAFRGAFDSFEDFADKLFDAFKTLFANIAAEKFLSGLFEGVFSTGSILGGVFGGGGEAGTTAEEGSGVGRLLGNIGTSFLAFAGAASLFFSGASIFLRGGGTATQIGAINATQGFGAAAAGAGLGFVSGSVTDQILGSRGDPGTTAALSAIGGAIGSIFGPIGSLIGGAIGSLVSNIFGGAKKLENATLEFSATAEGFNAVVETIVSKQKSFFRGRKFTVTRTDIDTSVFDDALASVLGIIEQISEALGVDAAGVLEGFSFSKEINIIGKSEEEIKTLLEDLFNEVLIGLIEEFVNNVEGLSDRLSKTVETFKGSTDDFLRAFELAAAIDIAFLIDPVAAVTEAIAKQNQSLTTTYNDVLVAYRVLLSEYDGSLDSLEALSAATTILVQVQTQLAAALILAGQEISALFQDSAQTIRESLLSEEELFNLRKSQIDELIAQAALTTDPAELQSLAEEINRLGLDAFNLLDEDQRAALGPEFIEFFEMLDALFAGQIDTGLETIIADQAALDEEVSNRMLEAAEALLEAARLLEQQERERELDERFPRRSGELAA